MRSAVRLVFSRKGFDSSSGGCPSPIIDGRPISIPIPTENRSSTTYEDLGLGDLVERTTKGNRTGTDLCHNDPMFENGKCAFGQSGAAQSHLDNNGVDEGSTFLFFGLFSEVPRKEPHHRIYGYLRVDQVIRLGPTPSLQAQPKGFTHQHPHTIGEWNINNTLYVGQGSTAQHSSPRLRLTEDDSRVSHWIVPSWLREAGLTYHSRASRWIGCTRLISAGRGQEFVSDVTNNQEALDWQHEIVELISARE